MSLILDALKRAERERNAERTGVLAEPVRVIAEPARPRRYWRITGLGLLVLIAGLLSWSLLRDPPAQSTAATEPEPVSANVIPGTEAVASLDDLTDEPVEEEMDGGLPPAAQTQFPQELAPAAPVPETQLPEAQPPQTAPAETPLPEAEPGLSPAPDVPPVLTQPAPLRKFREMPPAYRADFPAITIEVHVYEPDAAKRLVMINGRRYREGERMSEGPAVIEIVRDGIVFEHRGEKVLYTLKR